MSKRLSLAVAGKDMSVRKAAEDALASGVKISKCIEDLPAAEETLLKKDSIIGNLTKPLISALIFKLSGTVNGKPKPN